MRLLKTIAEGSASSKDTTHTVVPDRGLRKDNQGQTQTSHINSKEQTQVS